jgi:hypothetical protein
MKAIAIPQTTVQPKPQLNPTQPKRELVAQWVRIDGKLVCKWFTI